MADQPEAIRTYGPAFHLRDNFYFSRSDDGMVMIQHGDTQLEVPLIEWASAVHATAGDVSYAEVARGLGIEFVSDDPPDPSDSTDIRIQHDRADMEKDA